MKDGRWLRRGKPNRAQVEPFVLNVNVVFVKIHAEGDTVSNYNNFGQVGAMGDKARSDSNTFLQSNDVSPIDLSELARQLAQVREKMKRQAEPEQLEHDEAIGAIASAEKAAKAGDQTLAPGYLRGAGAWASDVAKSVAAAVVKDAIEGKLGLWK